MIGLTIGLHRKLELRCLLDGVMFCVDKTEYPSRAPLTQLWFERQRSQAKLMLHNVNGVHDMARIDALPRILHNNQIIEFLRGARRYPTVEGFN